MHENLVAALATMGVIIHPVICRIQRQETRRFTLCFTLKHPQTDVSKLELLNIGIVRGVVESARTENAQAIVQIRADQDIADGAVFKVLVGYMTRPIWAIAGIAFTYDN